VIQRATSENGPWTNITIAGKDDTSYTDSGLEPDTKYYYRIMAVDETGNESPYSAGAFATTEAEDEFPWILILIPIIIVVVILLILLLGRKKKKEEGIPPEEAADDVELEEENAAQETPEAEDYVEEE
jgi:hypothetical protein